MSRRLYLATLARPVRAVPAFAVEQETRDARAIDDFAAFVPQRRAALRPAYVRGAASLRKAERRKRNVVDAVRRNDLAARFGK